MRVAWEPVAVLAILGILLWAMWVAVEPQPTPGPETIPAPVYESSRG